jgi:hypothetical protein
MDNLFYMLKRCRRKFMATRVGVECITVVTNDKP